MSSRDGFAAILKAFDFFFERTFEQLLELWQKESTNPIRNMIDEFSLFLLVVLAIMVLGTNIFMVYFLIAAIIESYNKVSQNLKN
jgi:hypothetical protein